MSLYTPTDMINRIRSLIKASGKSQAAYAKSLGMDEAHFSAVMTFKRPIPPKLMDVLNVNRITMYEDRE